jgi:uncharacterized protein YjbJ (UPF0337 family)
MQWIVGNVSHHTKLFSDCPSLGYAYYCKVVSQHEEGPMNWDIATGNWKQFKGKIKEQWGKLTDDELDKIAGKRDQLVGRVQERYGVKKDEAEKQVKDWETRNPM